MNITRHFVDSDLTERALCEACSVLRVEPAAVVIMCSTSYMADLQLLQEKYGCDYVALPPEILKDGDYWAIRSDLNGDVVWSPGA